MKPNRSFRWSRRPSRARYVALEVAEAFCEGAELSEIDEVEQVQYVALCVGQSLADAGRPGAWDRIDVEALMACVPDQGAWRSRFVGTLQGLLRWMESVGALPRRCVRGYVEALHGHVDVGARVLPDAPETYGTPWEWRGPR